MKNARAIHKRKASSINRAFVSSPFSPRVPSDSSVPTSSGDIVRATSPLATTCLHPFAEMRVANWYVSQSGRSLTIDAFCAACGVRYVRGFATAPEEPTLSAVPGEHLAYFPKSS